MPLINEFMEYVSTEKQFIYSDTPSIHIPKKYWNKTDLQNETYIRINLDHIEIVCFSIPLLVISNYDNIAEYFPKIREKIILQLNSFKREYKYIYIHDIISIPKEKNEQLLIVRLNIY